MKKKLNTLFVLITLSLAGIIIFQLYWSFSAYTVNKNKFDADIDVAMQKAMDDCKKDYFDSIRLVIVRRLADTGMRIKIDTLTQEEAQAASLIKVKWSNGTLLHLKSVKKTELLNIYLANSNLTLNDAFKINIPQLNYYRTKINHPATIPELITETSFYVPELMDDLTLLFSFEDISREFSNSQVTKTKNATHQGLNYDKFHSYGVFLLPPNFREADSLKLCNYYRTELNKVHIPSPFQLRISLKTGTPGKLTVHYSETAEYSYKYHGFAFLKIRGPEFFIKAVFHNPQYAIIKSMLIPLCLTLLLMLLTIYCFYYIVQLVIHQKKLAELKDDFINNMTHELKTPIATITVAIEALQKFNALNDPEKTQRYLQTSRLELSKLNNLVTKVLNVAAFENKDIDLHKEHVVVDELVSSIIASEKLKTDKKIDFTYTNKDIGSIYADRLHFGNVLANIIDNAVKYSKEPANVTITCFKEGVNAIFIIKDNGIGIPAAHIGQIFEKFHRVPTGNVHNVKGTGLGLSYAKYIANAHGGNILVKSEINKGSEFIVSIPLSNG